MTLADLIESYRIAAFDLVEPFLAPDEEVRLYLNEAQDEAAIRGRLLRATAERDPSMCAIQLAAGESHATLHPALYELSYQGWRDDGATRRAPMMLRTREWMDRNIHGWRDMPADTPKYLVIDGDALDLAPAPAKAGSLLLEGFRLPAKQMELSDDEPSIPAIHHRHLVQWALARILSAPDHDLFDPNRAAIAEGEFSRYFGLRPDSDLRHETHEDEQQHNVAWW